MKKLLALAAAASALALAAPASAQTWRNIDQRQAQLDQRIDVGVRNGSLTRNEASQLRMDFRGITRIEAQYRATGGGLSAWERSDLDRRFDNLSARIRYDRHDAQDARWTSINARQAQLDARIDQGVRDGSLNRTEAYRLRTEFRQIADLERRYRFSSGGLSQWERADLDRRFDNLSQRIYAERRDYNRRG